MSKEILYILLPDFASHEMVYLMEAISKDIISLTSRDSANYSTNKLNLSYDS